MEVLVLLSALLVAISDTFAFALNTQDVTVGAELTRTDLETFLLFILKGEIRSRHLDQNDL